MAGRDEEGFTLLELLVVIIILGILAAIAVPVFLRQREKGWRTNAVSDMKNAATAVESYATDHEGSYLDLNGVDQTSPLLTNEGFRKNVWVALTVVTDPVGLTYCVRGEHQHLPGREFVYRSGAGVVQMDAPGVLPC